MNSVTNKGSVARRNFPSIVHHCIARYMHAEFSFSTCLAMVLQVAQQNRMSNHVLFPNLDKTKTNLPGPLKESSLRWENNIVEASQISILVH